MRVSSRAFAVACALAQSTAAESARAEVRLLEQEADGVPQRYLDLGVYGQPGFIWRQRDDNNPVTDTGIFIQSVRLTVHGQIHPMAELKAELEAFPAPALA